MKTMNFGYLITVTIGCIAILCNGAYAAELISGKAIDDLTENPEKYRFKDIVIQGHLYMILKGQLERKHAKGQIPFLIEEIRLLRCYAPNNLSNRNILFNTKKGEELTVQGKVMRGGISWYFQVKEILQSKSDTPTKRDTDSPKFEKSKSLILEMNNNPQKLVNRNIELVLPESCDVHSIGIGSKKRLSKYGIIDERYKRCRIKGLENPGFIKKELAKDISEPLKEGEFLRLTGFIKRFELGGGRVTKKGRRRGVLIYHFIVTGVEKERYKSP